ncbi:MAG: type VI secretion system tube protein Hcp [Candidatus Thiodiazotropha sp. (ex. Lucinisca nassula)]|uniref:Hcp family type VI secretion system effector n=1 Tax=Candidatus Thiodiazotropha sp. LNASS1 TaxID=3096260 RepID=UPI000D366E03|nr:type VI secretion system tube protein Hcp [Candidatus Thiodiazotropha sp. (ex. Lucinisca nassula)]MBW9272848.1 type VI secretion system tube protein Hcp [Candidatus Thiodiazotropha sp. (ex. Lucinisca nassula)]PUB75051.1 MAG: type VI secretion system tube protein Hcp [gamma proteobacterium symbiont of Ctena orbiculata]PUB86813.1 MAG: type VI secretion system tube protein Hcp [gamma proteobacterium symbiont of Ctena orbiculata]
MAVDMFMKIEGVDGESTDDAHSKWIELLSYSHGVSQPVSGASGTGGRTGGRADFAPFLAVKTVDNGTPDLNIKCAKGEHIPKVEVELCLASGDKHTFMKYTMEDVIVNSVMPGGSAGDETKPVETVEFAYGKIKWEYTPIDHTGKPGAATDRTWNLETNKQE